jgi:hypothetical protein
MNDANDTAPGQTPRALRFDFEKYRHFVEDESLTEPEARQLLEAIWTIICGFVDLGFGFDPALHALDARKKRETGA